MAEQNCTNCGAPINPRRCCCEYCGTTYSVGYADNVPVIFIETERPDIRVLQTEVAVPAYAMERMSAKDTSQYTLAEMKRQLADALTGLIEIKQNYDMERDALIFRGRVRVLEPTFRF